MDDTLFDRDILDAVDDIRARIDDIYKLSAARGWGETLHPLLDASNGLYVARTRMDAVAGDAPLLARRGDFLGTFACAQFWPLDPKPEEIVPEDIAHALALKCRFGGHSRRFYSVAEHSLRVFSIVQATSERAPAFGPFYGIARDANIRELAGYYALLHDAAEAYLADIPRPVKPSIREWKAIEARVDDAVLAAFSLPPPSPEVVEIVKWADRNALVLEAEVLFDYDVHQKWPGLPMLNLPPEVFAAPGVQVPRDMPEAGMRVFEDTMLGFLRGILARPEPGAGLVGQLAESIDGLASALGGPKQYEGWKRETLQLTPVPGEGALRAEMKMRGLDPDDKEKETAPEDPYDAEAEMRRRGLID